MNDFAAVKTCRCDQCRKTGVGLEYYHMETPVLFICAKCEPNQFAEHATQIVFNTVVASLFGRLNEQA